MVTQESTQSLGLRTKMTAIALVKASSVVVATDLEGAKVSARNQLVGKVSAVTPGAVNAEVVIDLDGGGSIAAIVTEGSVRVAGPGTRQTGDRAVQGHQRHRCRHGLSAADRPIARTSQLV